MTAVTSANNAVRTAGRPTALTPEGAQAVFRATLDALATPGTVRRLPRAETEPLAGHVPAALLPLLALADLSTKVCVMGDEAGADGADGPTVWDEIVRVATNAPHAALKDARLVAALRPLGPAELASLRVGTAAAPEDGALACLAVAGIEAVDGTGTGTGAGSEADHGAGADHGAAAGDGAKLLRLSGPGVPGPRAIVVTGLPAGFAAARGELVGRFPAGADLLLITPDGAMAGLSRTTTVNEEAV
jgi:alpha-D-ribose 1-methylphosphonate 5-triphosphate synthase subunit PhnH